MWKMNNVRVTATAVAKLPFILAGTTLLKYLPKGQFNVNVPIDPYRQYGTSIAYYSELGDREVSEDIQSFESQLEWIKMVFRTMLQH
jgi:hypothetical protein